jgi:hypothetical protein
MASATSDFFESSHQPAVGRAAPLDSAPNKKGGVKFELTVGPVGGIRDPPVTPQCLYFLFFFARDTPYQSLQMILYTEVLLV